MKTLWEKTKDMCFGLSKMPPLNESNLSNPSFRFVLCIMNSVLSFSPPLQNLFTEDQLQYANYNSKEPEGSFMEYLVHFVDSYSKEPRLGYEGKVLVGNKRNPANALSQSHNYSIRPLLQTSFGQTMRLNCKHTI